MTQAAVDWTARVQSWAGGAEILVLILYVDVQNLLQPVCGWSGFGMVLTVHINVFFYYDLHVQILN